MIVLLLPVVIYWGMHIHSRNVYNQVWQELKTTGSAQTADEMRKIYPPSSPELLQNIWDIFKELEEKVGDIDDPESFACFLAELRGKGTTLEALDIDKLKKFKIDNATLLARFEEFSPNLETLRFNLDYESGINMPLDSMRYFSWLAHFYGFHALLAFRENNQEQALKYLDMVSLISTCCLREPCATSHTIGQSFAVHCRWWMIRDVACSPIVDQLSNDTLKHLIAGSKKLEDICISGGRDALRGEMYIQSAILKSPESAIQPDFSLWRKMRAKLFISSPWGYYDAIQSLKQLEVSRGSLEQPYIPPGPKPEGYRPFSSGNHDLRKNFEQSINRFIAWERSMRTAFRAELYRREHGKLPEDISILRAQDADTTTVDPFNGLPLLIKTGEIIYPDASRGNLKRTTVDGFVVYSVGFDGKDNGGNLMIYGTVPYDYGFPVGVFTRQTVLQEEKGI